MALRDQPYFPLYVQDFLTDEKLNECSANANGIYIRLMCIMHKSEEYGKFLLKQKNKQKGKQIENFAYALLRQMPYTFDEIRDGIEELLNEKIVEIAGDYLIQKRMVSDNELSMKRAEAGRKGGLSNKFAKAKSKANTEYEYVNEYENDSLKEEEEDSKKEKKKYAEFVSLKKDEYETLKRKHGEFFANKMIQVLDNYKGAKGKRYKSDYRAILSWVEEKVKSGPNYAAYITKKRKEDLKRRDESKEYLIPDAEKINKNQ